MSADGLMMTLGTMGLVLGLGPHRRPFGGEVDRCTRVGGDLVASSRLTGAGWRAGDSLIDTPLPERYPAPTPPGAIEVKVYDVVRRAEITMEPPIRDGAFWPLFGHIQERGIEMTAPVEMDFPSWADDDEWTMAFLYSTRDDGETTEGGRVRVVDSEGGDYLSIGVRGPYEKEAFAAALTQLESWLDGQRSWTRARGVRVLGYNGPMTPEVDRWAEVQVGVRPVR